MIVSKRVIVTFSEPGFHNWPEASSDVSYLASKHRHIFWFRVEVCVEGDNREVEFHTLLKELHIAMFRAFPHDPCVGYMFGDRSCEKIALDLRAACRSVLGIAAIEVWEDGECGARVEWST